MLPPHLVCETMLVAVRHRWRAHEPLLLMLLSWETDVMSAPQKPLRLVDGFGKIIINQLENTFFSPFFSFSHQICSLIALKKCIGCVEPRNRPITKGLGNQQRSGAGNHYCNWYFSFSLPNIEVKVVASALLIPASTWFITPVCCCVTQRCPTPVHAGVFPKKRANSNGWCRRCCCRFPIFCQCKKAQKQRFNCLFWLQLLTYVLQPALAFATPVVVLFLIASLFCWNACFVLFFFTNILLTVMEINLPITKIHHLSKKITQNSKDALLCVLIPHLYISGCLC